MPGVGANRLVTDGFVLVPILLLSQRAFMRDVSTAVFKFIGYTTIVVRMFIER